MRVAIAQARPGMLNLAGSVERAVAWIGRAADASADLVAFGETFIGGYPKWVDWPGWSDFDSRDNALLYARQVESSIALGSRELRSICEACRSSRIAAALGANLRSESGKSIYNAMIMIDAGGELRQVRRKLRPTHGERLCWAPAPDAARASVESVELAGARVGTLMCWEHWMPRARAALHANGETIHIAAWPNAPDLHHLASRHYAFEGSCFVLVTSLISPREDFEALGLDIPADFDGIRGGSAIIAPDTRYIVEPVYDEERLITADIDPNDALATAFRLDTAGHYDRADIDL